MVSRLLMVSINTSTGIGQSIPIHPWFPWVRWVAFGTLGRRRYPCPVHLHGAHAGFGFAVDHRPVNGGGTVLGQDAHMYIDASTFGSSQRLFQKFYRRQPPRIGIGGLHHSTNDPFERGCLVGCCSRARTMVGGTTFSASLGRPVEPQHREFRPALTRASRQDCKIGVPINMIPLSFLVFFDG